jgi:hypothetical protein
MAEWKSSSSAKSVQTQVENRSRKALSRMKNNQRSGEGAAEAFASFESLDLFDRVQDIHIDMLERGWRGCN